MARKSITIQDKQIVKQRLAMGFSTREAIKGTLIKSNKTAALIAQKELHEITQLRSNYLEMVRSAGAGEQIRASILADMLTAYKIVATKAPDKSEPWTMPGYFVQLPDYNAQLKAIKYIDSLAGINTANKIQRLTATQVNIDKIQTS
jgi:hypothetical protein